MIRKILILFLILVVTIGVVSAADDTNATDDNLKADDSINQPIMEIEDSDPLQDNDEGEFIDVSEAYDYLNQFRCEEGVWQWNSDDATKTYFNSNDTVWLKPMVRDADLEETAKIRAKELSVYYSHTRPDGTDCYTAFPKDMVKYGENIAVGQSSCKEVTVAWMETDDFYDGQGHRRNMLDSDFNIVGIAAYKLNGVIYWVQDFACKYDPVDVEMDKYYMQNNSETPVMGIEMPIYATGDFIVKINGCEIARKTLFQGKANITIYGLNAGTYEVELIYSGDYNYGFANKTGRIVALGDSNSIASFTYLNTLLQLSDGEVKLEKDYSYDEVLDVNFKNGIYISRELSIDGQGHTIDAKGLARIFEFSGYVPLKNLKLVNAFSTGYGSAVLAYDKICTLENCTFINNSAKNGGAVASSNQVFITNCLFLNNTAQLNGGAVYGDSLVSVENSNFISNNALNIGGAVYNAYATLYTENTNYTNNTNLQVYSRYVYGEGNNFDDEYSLVFSNVTRNNTVVNLNRNLTATQTILINASNVTINGNGYTINAQNRTRIFFITGDNIILKNITLMNGNSIGEGGAVFAESSNISLFDCVFKDNFAETGACVSTHGNVFIASSRFVNNTASAGGAIFSDYGNITVTDSLFKNNDASSHAGAIYTTGMINITSSRFSDNDAGKYGGALFTNGNEYGKVYITDSIFTNNTSKDSGGVFISSVGSVITNSSFINNYAGNQGGVASTWGAINVVNSNFTGNAAGNSSVFNVRNGNAVIAGSNFINNAAGKSGTVNVYGDAIVSDSIFTNNKAESGSGAISAVNMEIMGCDFTDNGGVNVKTLYGNVKLNNSRIIENGKDVTSIYTGESTNTNGTGNTTPSSGNATPSSGNTTPSSGNGSDVENPVVVPQTVKKATKIAAKKKTFKAKAKSKKYTITLKADGKPVSKVKVYLKIKGKTYVAITNAKGKATFKIKLKKHGTFKSTVSFKGNEFYLKSSKNVKIKLK